MNYLRNQLSRHFVPLAMLMVVAFPTGFLPSPIIHRTPVPSKQVSATSDTTPPSAPTGLSASAISSSQVFLTWNASTDDVGVQGYKIFRNGVYVGSTIYLSFTDQYGLLPATTYTYTVSAFDTAGNVSAQSGSVSVTTNNPGVMTPSVPSSLVATAVLSTQVNLTWQASVGNVAVTGYKIFRNGVQVGTSPASYYRDTDLAPSTAYSYTVSALDVANNVSAQSGSASATTKNPGYIPPATDASRVLVMYRLVSPDSDNDGMGDSEQLARYYAEKRGVPLNNLLALDISDFASANYISYSEFYNQMVVPIKNKLTALGTTNIDMILLVSDLPERLTTGGCTDMSVDNALMELNTIDPISTTCAQFGFNPYFGVGWPTLLHSDPDKGHFDHSSYKIDTYNSITGNMQSDMYLVSRLGGPDNVLYGMDQIDQSLYAEKYLYPGSGYYNGNVYVDSADGDSVGSRYTDAYLTAQGAGGYQSYNDLYLADQNIAYTEHYVQGSGFSLKWENTTNNLLIGSPGATFSDNTPAQSAPRALFYGGWYSPNYRDVWQWLPGSVADDLNSYKIFGPEALKHGVSAATWPVDEPFLSDVQHPTILLYYLLKGYSFAEASTLATPDVGWKEVNAGDPLYTPLGVKIPVVDNLAPILASGYPQISVSPDTGSALFQLEVDNTAEPEVVNAKIEYGLDTTYGSWASSSPIFTKSPSVVVPLTSGNIYHYRVYLTDPVGNVTVTPDATVSTLYIILSPPSPPPAPPVGWWKFDEDSGTTAADSSYNNFNGTLINGPTWVSGQIGNALNFDGVDDAVDVGNPAGLTDLGSMSVSVWIYPRSEGQAARGAIFSKGYMNVLHFGNGGDDGVDRTNALTFYIQYSGGALMRVTSNDTVGLNTWQHVVLTWDGSTNASHAHIYINGVETTYQKTQNGNGARTSDVTRNFNIGRLGVGVWDGYLDEVRVYDRAIGSDEVQNLYEGSIFQYGLPVMPQ